jgi:teichuronic acid biosynthesis glycosyltransferase TuaH
MSTVIPAPTTPFASDERRSLALALAVADANWFTTENLFRELNREQIATLLLTCIDYRNAWGRGLRPWTWNTPLRSAGRGLWRRDLVLPSGWMKTYPRLGMRPIRQAIRRWRRSAGESSPLALVMTYPHYVYLRELSRPDLTVYFNVDDYTLYWPSHADAIRALEQRAVREADLTVCTSHLRAEQLRQAAPEAAGRIRHLPHGAPARTIEATPHHRPAEPPPEIAHLPRPLLGYVGSLEDRVDWILLGRLAQRFPTASLVLIGRVPAIGDEPWRREMSRVLAQPNVHAIGWRGQDVIASYNRAFDISLIPYRVDHPFNIACCPTKIMDTMGTGRPILSTALPECLLYERLFDVARDHDEFLERADRILTAGSDDGRAAERRTHAAENTCSKVANRLLDWLMV